VRPLILIKRNAEDLRNMPEQFRDEQIQVLSPPLCALRARISL
jgi:hypothetical protein